MLRTVAALESRVKANALQPTRGARLRARKPQPWHRGVLVLISLKAIYRDRSGLACRFDGPHSPFVIVAIWLDALTMVHTPRYARRVWVRVEGLYFALGSTRDWVRKGNNLDWRGIAGANCQAVFEVMD